MKHLKNTFICAAALCTAASGFSQVYSLTEQSFDNPEFRARFTASYVAESSVNPNITADEKGLFDEIVPLIQGDPKAAISRLQTAITPDSSAAFDFILGNLLYQEGEVGKSIGFYQTAIKKFPNYFRAYYNVGRAYIAEANYAKGLENLQKAISIQPGDGALYGLIGYCYLNLDKPATALDAYSNAIMLAPTSRDWKQGKLQCLVALEDRASAIGLLYEFIAAEPNNADWWKLQANQFVSSGETVKAASNLTIVKDMGKADGPTLTLLGDLLVNEGMIEQALESYLIALDMKGVRPQRMIEVINSLVYTDQIEFAKSLTEKVGKSLAATFSPAQELDFLNAKARLALKVDDSEGAANFLSQIVERDPLNGGALLSLSDLEKNRGDLAKAEYYAESASKIDAFAHRAYLSLAQLNVGKQDYNAAAKYLRSAQQIDPKDYVADYLLRIEQAALRM